MKEIRPWTKASRQTRLDRIRRAVELLEEELLSLHGTPGNGNDAFSALYYLADLAKQTPRFYK